MLLLETTRNREAMEEEETYQDEEDWRRRVNAARVKMNSAERDSANEIKFRVLILILK